MFFTQYNAAKQATTTGTMSLGRLIFIIFDDIQSLVYAHMQLIVKCKPQVPWNLVKDMA